MKSRSYKVIAIVPKVSNETQPTAALEKSLNELGNKGWAVDGIVQAPAPGMAAYVILHRDGEEKTTAPVVEVPPVVEELPVDALD